jgi:hypothetical protein
MTQPRDDKPVSGSDDADRRKFLSALGRFSVVTPPAITLLLSTTLASEAIAHSGGGMRRHPRDHDGDHDRDHHHH